MSTSNAAENEQTLRRLLELEQLLAARTDASTGDDDPRVVALQHVRSLVDAACKKLVSE